MGVADKIKKMNTITLTLENIKCHGCANTIQKGLLKLPGVEAATVNVADSYVNVKFDDTKSPLDIIKKKLSDMGYPETGHNSTLSKAKSFVSCAVGRLND